jgi:hypothetical protein
MKYVIWGLCVSIVCSNTLAAERVRFVSTTPTEPVKINQVMHIKECLANRAAAQCLNEKNIHLIQRILSNYVINKGSSWAQR